MIRGILAGAAALTLMSATAFAQPYDDGSYHSARHDPGARALGGGVAGAGTGALIGCLVTLPIGCAPGAAIGAAVGGGTGAIAGAATTPPRRDYPPPRDEPPPPRAGY
ncbi:MAG TPA: hypothetical protein VGL58_13065 [Caulobacteraceae bacterium]|jgi:hypothetical protein